MDLINNKLNIEIQKFCLDLEKKYNINYNNLIDLWFNKKSTERLIKCEVNLENKIKFNQKYNSDTIKIMNILFLICSDGVFGKIENNDVKPLTDEDEKICVKFGYKIMIGCLNDIPI
ncbi:hypothetical protein IIV6-T1_047 [Invertebrate iridescent virus 6]|nr:hypothetical protein IIV6-T1_047 [Invertebrate iridescent virus 6]